MYLNEYKIIDKKRNYIKIYIPSSNKLLKINKYTLDFLNSIKNNQKKSFILDTFLKILRNKKPNVYKAFIDSNLFFDDNTSNYFYKVDFDIKQVYIHVSQECNLNCTYCYAKQNIGKEKLMSQQTFLDVVKKIRDCDIKSIILTGGEPLLNKNIVKFANIIKEKFDAKLEIITNGTLLHKYEKLLNVVDKVTISFDLIHSDNRKGLDKKALINYLRSLDKNLKKKLRIRSVVTAGEEKYINRTKEYIENTLGIEYIVEMRIPNNLNEIKFTPRFKQEYFHSTRLLTTNCGACNNIIAIDFNGAVYPCQSLIDKRFMITNILNENWKKELNGSKIRKKFKESSVNNIDGCKDCDVRYICGGGCRAIAYKVYGNLDSKLSFLCNTLYYNSLNYLNSIEF